MGVNETDTRYLEHAMDLAEKGRGCTSPNPVVGAVIVGSSGVLGEGYHIGPGQDHAEVAAIKDALRRAEQTAHADGGSLDHGAVQVVCRGATMYVTLEPCCTYGRTPPCTDALVSAGLGRVVVGAIDPSPEVRGRGVDLLRTAGIEVDVADGPLARRAQRQNNGYRKAATRGLPFVTYKYAMSLDGRLATDAGDSKWISSADSRALVHQWRAWSDAVVVGAGTVAADDPRLTAREVTCARQPLRVVVDRSLQLEQRTTLVASVGEGPVLAVCGPDVSASRRSEVESWGLETVVVGLDPRGALDPVEVGRKLVERAALEVLLEGGPHLAGAWWTAGAIDKVAVFVCPVALGGEENRGSLCGAGAAGMEDAVRLLDVEARRVGPDVLVSGFTGEPF